MQRVLREVEKTDDSQTALKRAEKILRDAVFITELRPDLAFDHGTQSIEAFKRLGAGPSLQPQRASDGDDDAEDEEEEGEGDEESAGSRIEGKIRYATMCMYRPEARRCQGPSSSGGVNRGSLHGS